MWNETPARDLASAGEPEQSGAFECFGRQCWLSQRLLAQSRWCPPRRPLVVGSEAAGSEAAAASAGALQQSGWALGSAWRELGTTAGTTGGAPPIGIGGAGGGGGGAPCSPPPGPAGAPGGGGG